MRLLLIGLLLVLGVSRPVAAQEVCQVTGTVGAPLFTCGGFRACSTPSDCTDLAPVDRCDPVGVCMAECGTVITCVSSEDCEAVVSASICVFTNPGSSLPAGFCELPSLPITYCESTTLIDDATFVACHTLPFSDTLTPSWFDGDCDGDGCPNNSDPTPCDPRPIPSGCSAPTSPARVCGRRLIGVGHEQCTFFGGELSCATNHACVGGDPNACPGGFDCVLGTCRPTVCGSLYSCRTDMECMGTPLGNGLCVQAPEIFGVDTATHDGFCNFDSYRTNVACLGMLADCAITPLGDPTTDFFQGDCDGDGCPNGADETVCAADPEAPCPMMNSAACGTPLVRRLSDAGTELDGGTTEAGMLDGGVSVRDGGTTLLDGGTPMDTAAPPQVHFGGGGGCSCGATRRPRDEGSLLIALLALGATAGTRRRW